MSVNQHSCRHLLSADTCANGDARAFVEVTTPRRVPEGEDDEGGGVVVTRGNVRSVVHGGRSYVCVKCSAGCELSRL